MTGFELPLCQWNIKGMMMIRMWLLVVNVRTSGTKESSSSEHLCENSDRLTAVRLWERNCRVENNSVKVGK